MLSGTAQIDSLFDDIAVVPRFDIDSVAIRDVEVMQLQFELAAEHITDLLPPALHPTLPPLGQWVVWNVPSSPWGNFSLVQFKISCRSGSRPRSFLLGSAINNDVAQSGLQKKWGISAKISKIEFDRSYESAELTVSQAGSQILHLKGMDPQSLLASDIQFFAAMHAANTPSGLRLIQFDPRYEVQRAERYSPVLVDYCGTAWGNGGFRATYPVVGYGVNANIELPRIRFVCKPNVSAFVGTEAVT